MSPRARHKDFICFNEGDVRGPTSRVQTWGMVACGENVVLQLQTAAAFSLKPTTPTPQLITGGGGRVEESSSRKPLLLVQPTFLPEKAAALW